ncbi:hypothetical protein GH714_033502 [Hevea brasiliensis]|uniref:Uncharacterized protein n=1 Tax=Hevea brasiliensis TaxID=3981 RepID=A0A6A6MM35_HEVBR|nr:hypothetical protein GH714_033502 [Hevea brasiliensis]
MENGDESDAIIEIVLTCWHKWKSGSSPRSLPVLTKHEVEVDFRELKHLPSLEQQNITLYTSAPASSSSLSASSHGVFRFIGQSKEASLAGLRRNHFGGQVWIKRCLISRRNLSVLFGAQPYLFSNQPLLQSPLYADAPMAS